MSHNLDAAACLDPQRREDLARNDAAMAPIFPLEAKQRGLRFYLVNIGPRANPRLSYTVMARSSSEAWEQNVCLREGEERMEVLPADEERNPFPVKVVRQELAAAELREAADLARNASKGPRLAALNDRRALEAQVQHMRCVGAL